MFLGRKQTALVAPEQTLPGRSERPWHLSERHAVLDAPLVTDTAPAGHEVAIFGLGCFWGAEEVYWQVPGVWSTSVGYAGGDTPHPSYEEVCSGRTNHTEAVRVVFDPAVVSYADLVKRFFEVHDPTQGMRQGNDVGTQYRSAIFYEDEAQRDTALEVIQELDRDGPWDDPVVTTVELLVSFYPAEEYHDEYFRRNEGQPYCQVVVAPKVGQFRQRFAYRMKSASREAGGV
ncbi:peptide-methionine (S)-S-oxide reductase MsrA [uncultured Nocardioides sp.]|uniref:peptide-methionine (S)-S-oxide reductase MsrA n=1 Tax=uncultured Nocardioides sp. TaxID=198441 RepID=UPI00262C4E7A|nr:peptide-methionine (S)-S-oxide reductase MsrA [uncultured Nocardioides sp.]